jgi:hypothetical protein
MSNLLTRFTVTWQAETRTAVIIDRALVARDEMSWPAALKEGGDDEDGG